jgi:hypothetical protein
MKNKVKQKGLRNMAKVGERPLKTLLLDYINFFVYKVKKEYSSVYILT